MDKETKESGPIQTGIWDTRDKDNCFWCEQCEKWIRKNFWVSEQQHKETYCKGKKNEKI